jgi:hypothetical protein
MNTAMMIWPMTNMADSPGTLGTYGRRPRLILGPDRSLHRQMDTSNNFLEK